MTVEAVLAAPVVIQVHTLSAIGALCSSSISAP